MDRIVKWALWGAVIVFAIVVVRTAWICDDAYITFRTVRNFVGGEGLCWNLAERVQTYTHPLWMFALSVVYALTHDVYYSALALSFVTSMAAVIVIARRLAPTDLAGLTCVVILVSSRSFVDYSTSGLENPLTNLLVALLAIEYLSRTGTTRTPRELTRLAMLTALCALNRFDTVLLGAPLLVVAWWPTRSVRGALAIALGFAPLFAWELFSLVYYGFLFPNTAYAKLPAAIGVGARIGKGLSYLGGSAVFDPVIAVTLVVGIAAPLIRRQRALYPIAIAIALYLLYILYVGGDFMAGRFLTGPMVFALAAATRAVPLPTRLVGWIPAAVALALGLVLGPRAALISGGDYGMNWPWQKNVNASGISDERGIYYKFTGLIRKGMRFKRPRHRWFDEGAGVRPGQVHAAATVGFIGWGAPPAAIIIDQLALGDPLLARLPPIDPQHWRPGHIDRAIPAGYLETRRTGHNVIANHWLAAYYDDLALVTQGPIWSADRFAAIWRLNTGGDRALLAHALDVEVAAAALATPVAAGAAWNAPHHVQIPAGGALYIAFGADTPPTELEVCADHDDRYDLTFMRAGASVGTATAEPVAGGGIALRRVSAPAAFDAIVVRPSAGDRRYAVACVRPVAAAPLP
jgi:arabinofuranosyltransferase